MDFTPLNFFPYKRPGRRDLHPYICSPDKRPGIMKVLLRTPEYWIEWIGGGLLIVCNRYDFFKSTCFFAEKNEQLTLSSLCTCLCVDVPCACLYFCLPACLVKMKVMTFFRIWLVMIWLDWIWIWIWWNDDDLWFFVALIEWWPFSFFVAFLMTMMIRRSTYVFLSILPRGRSWSSEFFW